MAHDDTASQTADMSGLAPVPEAVVVPPLAPGTLVGRFLVVELVAEGGMGALYKAYDPQLDRAVAVKLVRTGAAGGSEGTMLRERLLREARALAKLSHPNVVTVYEAGAFGDEVFVAMEFVPGVSLRKWLAEAKRSREAVLAAFLAAGEGLSAAHHAGLVHRDVKPDNLLVGTDGRVRVVDFGLARSQLASDVAWSAAAHAFEPRALSERPPRDTTGASTEKLASASGRTPIDTGTNPFATPLTQVGSRMGTPRYMAPEQHLGFAATDKSDQFSWCVALYEALYGEHPFVPKQRAEFVDRVTKGRVAPAPRDATVPAWLRAVILRGLAPVQGERYPDMDALLRAVRADPAAARRSWLARAAVALGVLGVAGGAVYLARRPARVCSGASQPLADVWSPARAASVKGAFARSGLSYAGEAAGGVVRALDAYASEWSSLATSTCTARESRRVTVESSEATSRCLAERLDELRALTDALPHADERVVSHALSVALALPGPGECATPSRYSGVAPLPRDPATRARAEGLQRRRAELGTLADLGHLDEAKAGLEALLHEAEDAAHAPLVADVLFDLGRAYEYALDHERAESTLLRCIDVADAAHHDRPRAEARILLVRLEYSRARYDDAFAHAERAMAVVRRLGDERLEAQLLMQRAWARVFSGHADLGVADAREGLALSIRSLGPRAPLTAELHSALGTAASELEQNDVAERESREALSIVESTYAEHNERTARMAENLSLVLGNEGKSAEATRLQERAVAIAIELWGPDDVNTGIKLQNLGGILVDTKRPADAVPVLERAIGIFERDPRERDSQWEAYTLNALGGAFLDLGEPARAAPVLERAVALVEKLSLDPDIAGEARFRLAQTLVLTRGDRARAIALARKAIEEDRKVPRLGKDAIEAQAWLDATEHPAR